MTKGTMTAADCNYDTGGIAPATLPESMTKSIYRGMEPVFQRLLVNRSEEEAVTKGGIIIPDTAQIKPTLGEIKAVGPEATEQGFKAGDMVLFGKYSGFEFTYKGTTVVVMNSEDVLIKIHD